MNHFLSLSLYFLLEYLPKVDALTKRECVLCEMIRYFNDRQQSIHGVGTTDTLPSHATKKKQNQSRYRILSIVDGSSSIEIINPCQGRWWWRGCNRRANIYIGTSTGTTSTIEGRKTKVRTKSTYFGTKISFYIRFLVTYL